MKIKVCGMKEPANIAEVAMLNPDYMGFIFYEHSPRFAGGLPAAALQELAPGIKKTGVFVDAPEEYILSTAEKYGLDLVQLHGHESPETCRRMSARFGILKAFGIAAREDLERTAAYEGCCTMYVFDAKTPAHGGSGVKFDHDILKFYRGETPYLLGGGISPDDAGMAGTLPGKCAGLDINSRFETAPGIKNAGTVRKFMSQLKTQKI